MKMRLFPSFPLSLSLLYIQRAQVTRELVIDISEITSSIFVVDRVARLMFRETASACTGADSYSRVGCCGGRVVGGAHRIGRPVFGMPPQ